MAYVSWDQWILMLALWYCLLASDWNRAPICLFYNLSCFQHLELFSCLYTAVLFFHGVSLSFCLCRPFFFWHGPILWYDMLQNTHKELLKEGKTVKESHLSGWLSLSSLLSLTWLIVRGYNLISQWTNSKGIIIPGSQAGLSHVL